MTTKDEGSDNQHCLFACVDALRPSQHFSVMMGRFFVLDVTVDSKYTTGRHYAVSKSQYKYLVKLHVCEATLITAQLKPLFLAHRIWISYILPWD